jgi:hypothetical protein
MFDTGRMSDELKALRVDVARLLSTAGEDSDRSHDHDHHQELEETRGGARRSQRTAVIAIR